MKNIWLFLFFKEKNTLFSPTFQAGMSALLTPDNPSTTTSSSSSSSKPSSTTKTFALIGAPGPFTWRGAVFALGADDGDFLFRDKTHYHTPVRASEAAPVDKVRLLILLIVC